MLILESELPPAHAVHSQRRAVLPAQLETSRGRSHLLHALCAALLTARQKHTQSPAPPLQEPHTSALGGFFAPQAHAHSRAALAYPPGPFQSEREQQLA